VPPRDSHKFTYIFSPKNFSKKFGELFFSLGGIPYICLIKQSKTHFMKTTQMTAEAKAKKAAYDKAYRASKKMNSNAKPELVDVKIENSNTLPEKFEKAFDFPVRLFKNLKLEKENSYKASAGSFLKFQAIKQENNNVVYRVYRTGRRTFFTTSSELVAPKA
jgi:hypothetical protein